MSRKSLLLALIVVLLMLVVGLTYHFSFRGLLNADKEISFAELQKMRPEKMAPSDYFTRQRAFPGTKINLDAYRTAIQQTIAMRQALPPADEIIWEKAGPDNIGGRITALDAHPSNPDIVYLGAADGGILKSIDGMHTWTPVFDETAALSIGDIRIDPNDPNTIWVGTGEANASGDSYPGDGIYKSTDGGTSWTHMGLENSYYIGRIAIDPTNSDRIFVAVAGALFDTNHERGVYRSEDGGVNWEQVHYLTDSTAAIDVTVNPQNPDIVYAAMWERIRRPTERIVGGFSSGIWRSQDGGDSWSELTNGLPPSASDMGRIGLGLSASNPNILYAIYADDPGYLTGIWKTANGGDSWVEINSPSSYLYSSYGWYFGQIYVDPTNPDFVFALGVPLYRSTDGGSSWSSFGGNMHVDHHAFWVNPNNPAQMYDGNDGGAYYRNTGTSWTKSYDLHVSQFYNIEIDFLNPTNLYGGTQDNGTLRTLTGNLDDWENILGGDGFHVVVDYADPDIVYAEYQWGDMAKSTNGGGYFSYCLSGVSSSDRRNWDTPFSIDPNNPNVLYYGTYRLYRTTNRAENWAAISGDLTSGPPQGNLTYNTLTTIAVAPTNSAVIYVGADDGNVWVTQNTGGNWTNISGTLPERWVTEVMVSSYDAGTAYVTLSGYKQNINLPHIYRTENYGQNWVDVSGNMPDVPVNVIVEDPENTDHLYIGTDLGVFYTENLGLTWQPFGTEIPLCTVSDMKLHNPTRILVAGTHGRSMYKTNIDSTGGVSDIQVMLTPESSPVLIPANGGSFNFNIAVENVSSTSIAFDFWADITLPNGSQFGPVIGPAELNLPGNFGADRDRTQAVPQNAPAGNYTYNAYVGLYPDDIWESDSFPFEKLTQEYGPLVEEWNTYGEPFSGENFKRNNSTPATLELLTAYPNPFNNTTTLQYELKNEAHVSVEIFNTDGQLVKTLEDDFQLQGVHRVVWNADNVASGVYVARVKTDQSVAKVRLILIK